jgi:hypothetical protein
VNELSLSFAFELRNRYGKITDNWDSQDWRDETIVLFYMLGVTARS